MARKAVNCGKIKEMTKQAIQPAELSWQLPPADKLQPVVLGFRQIGEQALKKEKAATHARKAGFSKTIFEMSLAFAQPLEAFKKYLP